MSVPRMVDQEPVWFALTERSFRAWLAAVIVAGVLARLAIMIPSLGHQEDADNYLPLARSLAEGRGFALNGRPTANRPPLYPLMLAPLAAGLGARAGWGVAGLHLLLGAGSVWLTARAAQRWGMSQGRILLAAAIVAGDPVLVAQARAVMTETLAAFLVAAALASLAAGGWRGAVRGGLALGLGALCRPSLLPAAILTALAAWIAGPGRLPERSTRAVAIVLATAFVLLPWAWRNSLVFGEPILTTTHGGYTLALANNPVYYEDVLDGPPGAVWSGPRQLAWWTKINEELARLPEPEADRRLRAAALRTIAERPRDFVRASFARWGRFWAIAPSGEVYPRWLRVATAVWTIPFWIALLAGLATRASWSWPRVAAPAMLLALCAVHAVYWTDVRMRAPLVPALALVACAACSGGDQPGSERSTPSRNRGKIFAKKI